MRCCWGRVTYLGFSAAWPQRSGDEFSDKMNSMEKYVVSKTLESAAWNNSTILRGDLVSEVNELKGRDGADIIVHGSATLAQSLLRADLVDELRLATYPLTLGIGRKLFGPDTRLDFTAVDSILSSTGVTLTTYRRNAR
jgi:dihydrofolate reductase